MSGWLETLPSKRVRAVYRDADGRRHSRTFPTRRQAKAFLAATVTDLDRGHWIDPRRRADPVRRLGAALERRPAGPVEHGGQ